MWVMKNNGVYTIFNTLHATISSGWQGYFLFLLFLLVDSSSKKGICNMDKAHRA
ncbi:hypothetical protein XIS1_240006 [Xenorhabdus innexi]|uniref:Uncharacterized protein n=1 Tax=Xenorhabdus innexi TaxID=290109 RepID=A0A1N6MXA8_9GAMM|nr:hypothetical protein XIS1_240006 [Xenorhabdus innexi]